MLCRSQRYQAWLCTDQPRFCATKLHYKTAVGIHAGLMAGSNYSTALQIALAVHAGTHSEAQDRGHYRQCHRELQRSSCACDLLVYHNSLDKLIQ